MEGARGQVRGSTSPGVHRVPEVPGACWITGIQVLLSARGDLYKAEYEGWYSVNDEAFVPQTQVLPIVAAVLLVVTRWRSEQTATSPWSLDTGWSGSRRLTGCSDSPGSYFLSGLVLLLT